VISKPLYKHIALVAQQEPVRVAVARRFKSERYRSYWPSFELNKAEILLK
jgi:hypothetical protein